MRSPSLRLRFGRRSDPNLMPLGVSVLKEILFCFILLYIESINFLMKTKNRKSDLFKKLIRSQLGHHH